MLELGKGNLIYCCKKIGALSNKNNDTDFTYKHFFFYYFYFF